MAKWVIEQIGKKPELKKTILVEGLPGIGNVGKVAVDFLIEKIKAKKLYKFSSNTFPHSVFVNEDNLVQLPTIEIYYKKQEGKKNDILFLAGDIQPIDEVSCYEFSGKILDILNDHGGKELITLGGIGLSEIPKKPKVFCTGNSKEIIKKYCSGTGMSSELYGVVGPIVGVSGLLVGLAPKKDLSGVAILAETYGHPMYLGVKGAREILKILKKKLSLDFDMKEMDEEIENIETEVIKRTEDLSNVSKQAAIQKLSSKINEVNYIG